MYILKALAEATSTKNLTILYKLVCHPRLFVTKLKQHSTDQKNQAKQLIIAYKKKDEFANKQGKYHKKRSAGMTNYSRKQKMNDHALGKKMIQKADLSHISFNKSTNQH